MAIARPMPDAAPVISAFFPRMIFMGACKARGCGRLPITNLSFGVKKSVAAGPAAGGDPRRTGNCTLRLSLHEHRRGFAACLPTWFDGTGRAMAGRLDQSLPRDGSVF